MYKNINLTKGDTLAFGVKIKFDEESTAQELETAYFTVKENIDDTNYVLQKKLNDGIVYVKTSGQNVFYTVRVEPKLTGELELKQYYYDFQIGLNGDIFTPLKGILTVEYEITD